MARYILTALAAFLCSFSSWATDNYWTQVPLRTASQASSIPSLPGGEGMQMVWDLVYSPSNNSNVYMLTDTSQVWKSTDAGVKWAPLNNNGFNANGGISMIALSKLSLGITPGDTDPDVLLVAGSIHSVSGPSVVSEPPPLRLTPNSGKQDGIYRSVDGGKSWTLTTPAGPSTDQVKFYRPDPNQGQSVNRLSMKGGKNFAFDDINNTIYVGTGNKGVLQSTDAGITWTAVPWIPTPTLAGFDYNVLDIKVFNNTLMLIVWVMDNEGTTFKLADPQPPPSTPPTPRTEVNHPVVSLFTAKLPADGEIFMPELSNVAGFTNFYPRSIHAHPCDDDSFYLGLGDFGVGKLSRSPDRVEYTLNTVNGPAWPRIPLSYTDGTAGGPAVSYIGVSKQCNGTTPKALYASLFGGGSLPYVSTDGGTTWNVQAANPGLVAAATQLSQLNVTADGGMYYGAVITPHPTDPDKALAAGNVVLSSADAGATWLYSNAGYTGGGAGGEKWQPDKGMVSKAFAWGRTIENQNRFAIFLMDWGPMLTEDGGNTFRSLFVKKATPAVKSYTTPADTNPPKATLTGDMAKVDDNLCMVTAAGSWILQTLMYSCETATAPLGDTWNILNPTGDFKFIEFSKKTGEDNIFYADNWKGTINLTSGAVTMESVTGNKSVISQDNSGNLYAASMENNQLVIQQLVGNNWENVGTPVTGFSPSFPSGEYNHAVVSADGLKFYVASSSPQTWGVWSCGRTAPLSNTNPAHCNQWYRVLGTPLERLQIDALGNLSAHALAVDPSDNKHVYVGYLNKSGRSAGVYESKNSGATWTKITNPEAITGFEPAINIRALSVNPSTKALYAGSYHGTWKYTPPTSP